MKEIEKKPLLFKHIESGQIYAISDLSNGRIAGGIKIAQPYEWEGSPIVINGNSNVKIEDFVPFSKPIRKNKIF